MLNSEPQQTDKIGQYVCSESDGKEIWDDITYLKEKKTKLIGIVK